MRAGFTRIAFAFGLVGCATPASAPASSESAPVGPESAIVPPSRAESSAPAPSGSAAIRVSDAKPVSPASAASGVSSAGPGALSAALHDADGKPLPQTEDRPRADSSAFLRRMELLVRAIAADDAALAHEAFFPVVAYEQVKDIAKPALDHERRLLAAFARNVHDYHRELGQHAEGIRFVRVEVPEDKVKWMAPGKEGNRVGYFRVLRARLVVATAEGKERSFELTSMISWRGEWYVVHLHGFK